VGRGLDLFIMTTKQAILDFLKSHPKATGGEVARALKTTKGYVSLVKRNKTCRCEAKPAIMLPTPAESTLDFDRWPLHGRPTEEAVVF